MLITNRQGCTLKAYAFHRKHGKGNTTVIKPGETGKVEDLVTSDGRVIPILGDLVCQEKPDNNGVQMAPIELIFNEELSVKIDCS